MFSLCTLECCLTPNLPEQIHLSYSNQPNSMTFQWITTNKTGTYIQYGPIPCSDPNGNNCGGGWMQYSNQSSMEPQTYDHGGWLGWIHTITLTNLTPGQRYWYRVGDPNSPDNVSPHGAWSQARNVSF